MALQTRQAKAGDNKKKLITVPDMVAKKMTFISKQKYVSEASMYVQAAVAFIETYEKKHGTIDVTQLSFLDQ